MFLSSFNFKTGGSFAKARRGFTIAEIVVVVGIFAFISLLVLVNFSSFDSSILLNNLAYDMALSIRKAQTFGLNVREAQVGVGFTSGFGIHFNQNFAGTSYVFFADSNNNDIYDSGGSELLESFTIGGGNIVDKFCGLSSGGSETCSDTGEIDDLSIVFTRPDPEASVRSEIPSSSWGGAKIYLVSKKGKTRVITVRSTGQISIQGLQ